VGSRSKKKKEKVVLLGGKKNLSKIVKVRGQRLLRGEGRGCSQYKEKLSSMEKKTSLFHDRRKGYSKKGNASFGGEMAACGKKEKGKIFAIPTLDEKKETASSAKSGGERKINRIERKEPSFSERRNCSGAQLLKKANI